MPDLVRGIPNLLTLWYRRHRWRVHPARLMNLESIAIDRPIFLVGLQGGGLTLLARMLRRHTAVVSVTGNYHYWAGPDEMQNVMGPLLPPELSGLHANIPYHPEYPQRDWLYAIDDLLPLYRRTSADATDAISKQLKHAIRLALHVNALNPNRARFLDKSQSFTVRMAFIQALLGEHAPHFVVVTRNPYALCLRSAMRVPSLNAGNHPLYERLDLAAQQWANSIRSALEDADRLPHVHFLRFEDLLLQPEATLRTACDFLGLTYSPHLLPQSKQRLPLGATGSSKGDGKWYPLRPDVNRSYLEQLDETSIAIVGARCDDLAQRFAYTPEGMLEY